MANTTKSIQGRKTSSPISVANFWTIFFLWLDRFTNMKPASGFSVSESSITMSYFESISFSAWLFCLYLMAYINSAFCSFKSVASSLSETPKYFTSFLSLLPFLRFNLGGDALPATRSRRYFYVYYCNRSDLRWRTCFTQRLSNCLLHFCCFYFKFSM